MQARTVSLTFSTDDSSASQFIQSKAEGMNALILFWIFLNVQVFKKLKKVIFDQSRAYSIMRDEFIKSNEYERELQKKQMEEKAKAVESVKPENVLEVNTKKFVAVLVL